MLLSFFTHIMRRSLRTTGTFYSAKLSRAWHAIQWCTHDSTVQSEPQGITESILNHSLNLDPPQTCHHVCNVFILRLFRRCGVANAGQYPHDHGQNHVPGKPLKFKTNGSGIYESKSPHQSVPIANANSSKTENMGIGIIRNRRRHN